MADTLRGLLDGHLVLSRDLAERGQFPAIDVLSSVSRAMPMVTQTEHRELATGIRKLLAAYRDAEDLIQVGAYAKGSDPVVDEAIQRRSLIEGLLKQSKEESVSLAHYLDELRSVLAEEVQ